MKVVVKEERVLIGDRISVSFQRTLRIPEDEQAYPLPPSLGYFTVHKIEDYFDRAPHSWRKRGGYFIAMYQREALWIGFDGADWKPNAIKVSIGGVNAISGAVMEEGLHDEPQDYIVCPDQPWLDGINAGDGFIRQFVALPLGTDYTVEAQLTGREDLGGIQLIVYEPKPGIFPDEPPAGRNVPPFTHQKASSLDGEMGIGAGGKIRQKIYPDQYGIETWDQNNSIRLSMHILNSEQYRQITGLEPPPIPVSAETYVNYGLPWFDLYDESKADLPPPSELKDIKTIGQKEREGGGRGVAGGRTVEVEKLPVRRLRRESGD